MISQIGALLTACVVVAAAINDVIKKMAAERFATPSAFVAYRGLLSTPLLVAIALALDGSGAGDGDGAAPVGPVASLTHGSGAARFWAVATAVAVLEVAASLLYTRALQVASLSVTVPFLALTPVSSLLMGFFELGEIPSGGAAVGVVGLSLGAFWLLLTNASTGQSPHSSEEASSERGSKSSESDPVQNGDDGDQAALAGAAPGEMLQARLSRARAWLASGPGMMLGVAMIWSVTSPLDKLGVELAGSANTYGAVVMLLTTIPVLVFVAAVGDEPGNKDATGGGDVSDGGAGGGLAQQFPTWVLVAGAAVAGAAQYSFHLAAIAHMQVGLR